MMGPLEFVVDENAKIVYHLTMFDRVASKRVIHCDGYDGEAHEVCGSLTIECDEFSLVWVGSEPRL